MRDLFTIVTGNIQKYVKINKQRVRFLNLLEETMNLFIKAKNLSSKVCMPCQLQILKRCSQLSNRTLDLRNCLMLLTKYNKTR